MRDWISFAVAFGVVIPWLLAGVCMLTEWTCEALKRCWRMRTDAIYREVDSQFKADLAEAGLDGRTIRVRSIVWWSSVVATGRFPCARHRLAMVDAVVDGHAVHRA